MLPETNTLKLEKPAENEDYTGTANEYENTVIKGDLTIYKSLEDDDVSNENGEDSDPTVKPKGEGIYFGIYLNSKAKAGGNNYFATGNDPGGAAQRTAAAPRAIPGGILSVTSIILLCRMNISPSVRLTPKSSGAGKPVC